MYKDRRVAEFAQAVYTTVFFARRMRSATLYQTTVVSPNYLRLYTRRSTHAQYCIHDGRFHVQCYHVKRPSCAE